MLLPDLHTDFSRGRSGGLVFPSLSEFSIVDCDPHPCTCFFAEFGNSFIMDPLAQRVKSLPAMQKTRIRSLDWKIPWKRERQPIQVYYHTIALISHTSKVKLKILQARLQQYVNHEIPDVPAGYGKAEEPEIKLPTSKKQGSSRQAFTSVLLTIPKPLTLWIATNCGIFLKRWEYQTTLPAS